MRRHFAVTTVMVLCSVLLLAAVCPAGDTDTVPAASPERHIKGMWKSTGIVVGFCPSGAYQVLESGKGFSSHMGAGELMTTYCIDPATGEMEGTLVVTAANGDTIITEFTGQSTYITSENGTFILDETITGGTGRFSGATGWVRAAGEWQTVEPGVTTSITTEVGEIRY